MDKVILQYIKIALYIYTQGLSVYCVIETNTPSHNRVGVAVFDQEFPYFMIKAHHKHGPNVVIFQIASEGQ